MMNKEVKNYGSFKFENETYFLTQDAYIDGPNDHPYYTAHAVKDDNEYQLIWEIEYDDDGNMPENEDERCDWDNPHKAIPIFNLSKSKLLMNPATGSVDTEENWLAEKEKWEKENPEMPFNFESLVEVEIGKDGSWIEKK